ncbi:MAG: dihydroorotate dehydrogenase electron transfer subunit, partial [Methanobacteriota archaeon]
MSDNLPVPVKVIRVVQEAPNVKSIFFDTSFESVPGQFVMVWIPGVDEIPMALSAPNAITVQEVGDATRILGNSQPGDKIGIRGPFGNGFTASGQVMAIAGGVGAAPLLPLARLVEGITFLQGA